MTDIQPADLGPAPEPAPQPKGSSGYRRLQGRHRNLIAEHESLKSDYEALQVDVENLLKEHQRLMATIKSPQPVTQVPWFEGATQTLASLAQNPDRRAIEVFVTALAVLQRRMDPIVSRLPL